MPIVREPLKALKELKSLNGVCFTLDPGDGGSPGLLKENQWLNLVQWMSDSKPWSRLLPTPSRLLRSALPLRKGKGWG